METNYNEEEDLKKMAPQLFQLEKKEVFSTPENYFEKLPGQMQDKVHAKTKAKNYWVPDYKLALVAASLCILVVAGIQFFKHKEKESNEIASSELLKNYYSLYLNSSDETEIIELMDDASLEKTSAQIEKNNGLTNKEIADYLLSENIDINTITNEF